MQAHMCCVLFLKTHMQPHMYMQYYFGDFSAGTQSCMSTLLLKKKIHAEIGTYVCVSYVIFGKSHCRDYMCCVAFLETAKSLMRKTSKICTPILCVVITCLYGTHVWNVWALKQTHYLSEHVPLNRHACYTCIR